MSDQKTIRHYYFFQLFFSLLFWVPIFYEYQKQFGLNDTQVFRIQSIYYLVFCLIEIPTGLFADQFGSRASMRLGAFFLILTNLIAIFWTNYTGFLIHFLVIALARSLISGASSSYLYEHLRRNGFAQEFKKFEGRARALGLGAKVLSWSVVGYLMLIHASIPYWLTAVSAAVALYFSYRLPDIVIERDESRESYSQRLFHVFRVMRSYPRIFLVMTLGIGVFVLARICQVNLFQPILNAKGFQVQTHGMIMAAMTLFEAVGALKPDIYVMSKYSDKTKMVSYTTLIALALISVTAGGQLAVVLGLSVFAYGVGLAGPVQGQLMNDVIPDSRVRATLLSVESIIDRAVTALVASFLGGIISAGQMMPFIQMACIISVLLVVFSILGLKLTKRAA